MIYIIILLIIIAIIVGIVKAIKALVGVISDNIAIVLKVVGTIALFVVFFLAFSWIGIILAFIIMAIIVGVSKSNKNRNEKKLIEHLYNECSECGYMTDDKWRTLLPDFVNLKYRTSFASITTDFAKQSEQKNFVINRDWFNLYLLRLYEGNAATLDELYNKTYCPQMKKTHANSDEDILKAALKEAEKGEHHLIDEKEAASSGELFYTLSEEGKKYLESIRVVSMSNDSAPKITKKENEIDINDL